MAVAAPSLHRSGRRYAWLAGPASIPLAALPMPWVQFIRQKGGAGVRPRTVSRSSKPLYRRPSISQAHARRLLAQMLQDPLVEWACASPDDVSREVWRGIATNLATVVLEHADLVDIVRKAFHALSEGYCRYSERETDTILDGAIESARTYGPLTFAYMKANGAPEALDRKSTRLNSTHEIPHRMPSSA